MLISSHSISMFKMLWRYQFLNYKGRKFCLTQLAFGLKFSAKIHGKKVFKMTLGKEARVDQTVNSYNDAILVGVCGIRREK